jgi:hypothetical protein
MWRRGAVHSWRLHVTCVACCVQGGGGASATGAGTGRRNSDIFALDDLDSVACAQACCPCSWSCVVFCTHRRPLMWWCS